MTEPARSQHPVDRLIRELIAADRAATADEIQTILDRIAAAPFLARIEPVRTKHRGRMFYDEVLGARETSLRYHLFKRIILDGQWTLHTSERQYLDDLHSVVRVQGRHLVLYERQSGAIAAITARTRSVIPAERLGPKPLPGIIVIYAADRGTLISGYQFSNLADLSIPEDARWYSGH